jgi:hypothetical protein
MLHFQTVSWIGTKINNWPIYIGSSPNFLKLDYFEPGARVNALKFMGFKLNLVSDLKFICTRGLFAFYQVSKIKSVIHKLLTEMSDDFTIIYAYPSLD